MNKNENQYVTERRRMLESAMDKINTQKCPDGDGYEYDWLQMAGVNVVYRPLIGKAQKIFVGKIGPYFDTKNGHFKRDYPCGNFSTYVPKEFINLEISQDMQKIQEALKQVEFIDNIEAAMGNHHPNGILIKTTKKLHITVAKVAKEVDLVLGKQFQYYESMLS